jgi:uncharacterized OB-fold protein
MTSIVGLGTYLPAWGSLRSRTVGADEDAVTLAVAAGRAAVRARPDVTIETVVVVSRDLPLIEGGNGAPVLAGLDLDQSTRIREVLGGASAMLDEITAAAPGTLVIGADASGAAGASAVLCDAGGVPLVSTGRVTRSLPIRTRDQRGTVVDYADPRLLRERGVGESVARLGAPSATVVAGLAGKDAAAICTSTPPSLPTLGASSPGFALAALADSPGGVGGTLIAIDQATVSVADLAAGSVAVVRDEPAPQPTPAGALTDGAPMSISLPAYERAFDAKVRLEAARCTNCSTLSLPPRLRCIECGHEGATERVPLPRDAEVYSLATIRVPVPGLVTPYTIVIAELGDTGVRTIVKLTGAAPGSVAIGDRGTLVLRLVAVRQGVPDYGYGFLPVPLDEVRAA